jgi:hypothetical protein
MNDEDRTRLQAEARYARDRFRLYRAGAYAGRPTNPARMRDLERERDQAEARLQRAKLADTPTDPK